MLILSSLKSLKIAPGVWYKRGKPNKHQGAIMKNKLDF